MNETDAPHGMGEKAAWGFAAAAAACAVLAEALCGNALVQIACAAVCILVFFRCRASFSLSPRSDDPAGWLKLLCGALLAVGGFAIPVCASIPALFSAMAGQSRVFVLLTAAGCLWCGYVVGMRRERRRLADEDRGEDGGDGTELPPMPEFPGDRTGR